MRKKPKKGDVIWLDAGHRVIGIFDRYDSRGQILYLSFPKNLRWRFDIGEVRGFMAIRPNQFKVLSAKETLEKLSLFFEMHLNALEGDLCVQISDAVKRLVI